MIVVGVDPGLSGAIAWLDNGQLIAAEDVPVMDGRIDASTLADMLASYPLPDVVVVEKVSSMPNQGVSSTFKFGQAYGAVLGVFGALKFRVVHVTPTRWKKDMFLGSDKEKARASAIDRWPESSSAFARKKDHGRAEAALIAAWYLDRTPNP